jgi:ABC-type multidrug transport system ATPase subunit
MITSESNFYFTIFTVVSFSFLQVAGEISYSGYKLDEFVPQKTSAYISQYDLHIPEMTVRETIDFSARCQGVGYRAGNVPCFLHVIITRVVYAHINMS